MRGGQAIFIIIYGVQDHKEILPGLREKAAYPLGDIGPRSRCTNYMGIWKKIPWETVCVFDIWGEDKLDQKGGLRVRLAS